MIQMQKNISSLKKGKEEFILDCKIRNLSQETIDYYNESFDYFIKYVEEDYPDISVEKDINEELEKNYIINMQDNNLKDTTINIRIRALRCVLYFFMKCGYIEKFKNSKLDFRRYSKG